MASFSKNLQKFFVYFFTGVSVIIVVLGISRVKQADTLGTTASPDNKNGSGDTTSGASTKVAGVSQTVTASGKAYQTPWGNLSTIVKVKDGKVIAVEIPELPDSPPSLQAKAYLIDQVLRTGSANIQGVSGATITSRAFKASLESAIATALAQEGVAASDSSATGTTPADTYAQNTTTAPTTTTTAPAQSTTVGAGVSGTFTGNAYQTPWGNAVASVTFTNGKITGVTMPQVPNSPPSIQAKPYLVDQVLAAGSANIQGVSGATYASIAFKSSLESAIAKASAQGTVSTPTPTAAAKAASTVKPSIPRKYHDDDDEYEERDHDNEWDD